MSFALTFETDNAAFGDCNMTSEVARILRKVARTIEEDGVADNNGAVHDTNGNKVGAWILENEEEE